MENCPACGIGELSQYHDTNIIEYSDETIEIKFFYSVCSECEIELILPEQLKVNKLINEIALMQHDKVLNIEEFRTALDSCVKVTSKPLTQ